MFLPASSRSFLLVFLIGLFISACSNGTAPVIREDGSQEFRISLEKDTVLESEQGILLGFQRDIFLTADGQPYRGEVKVVLKEALDLDAIMMNGWDTRSEKGLLETAGMFDLKALDEDGNPLKIAPGKEVEIRVPARKKKAGIELYTARFDSSGNMVWTDPQALPKYLKLVPVNELNFRPAGFDDQLKSLLPFGPLEQFSKTSADSLYFTFSPVWEAGMAAQAPAQQEAISQTNNQQVKHYQPKDIAVNLVSRNYDGVLPSQVKALQDNKFEKTYICTREFEIRMQVLHKNCKGAVLNAYVANIGKALYVADSMAARQYGTWNTDNPFVNFYLRKETYPREKPDSRFDWKHFFERRQAAYEQELKNILEKKKAAAETDLAEITALDKAYKKTEAKRRNRNAEYYDIKVRKWGLYGLNKPWPYDLFGNPIPEGTETMKAVFAEIISGPGKEADLEMAYVIHPYDQVLEKMYVVEPQYFSSRFLTTNINNLQLVYLGKSTKTWYFSKSNTGPEGRSRVTMEARPATVSDIKTMIGDLSVPFLRKDIKEEMRLMEVLQEKKEKALQEEKMENLRSWLEPYALSCYQDGCALFEANCASCHTINEKLTGPALRGITQRHAMPWIRRFVKNSKKMITTGDPDALKIYNEYHQTEMTSFENLSDAEIDAIIYCIEHSPETAADKAN